MAVVVKMLGDAHAMSADFNTSASGSAIAEGCAVGVNASGEIQYATHAATNTSPCAGVSLTSSSKGVFGDTVNRSKISYASKLVKIQDDTWTWTPGKTVWVLSGTGFTQTSPNGLDGVNVMIQQFGRAIDATTIQVDVGTPFLFSGGNIKSGI